MWKARVTTYIYVVRNELAEKLEKVGKKREQNTKILEKICLYGKNINKYYTLYFILKVVPKNII